MKIERDEKADLAEIVRDGIATLVHGRPEPRSAEERMLARRDQRRRRLRSHWHAYASVMTGLAAINILTWVLFGAAVPWVLFPMAGWGIGLGMHALGYRGWQSDHAGEIRAAEVALGRLPAGEAPKALPAGVATGPGGPWGRLLADCRTAVDKTADALTRLDHPAQDVEATCADLEEGLERVERLSEGAARIEQALDAIAPDGLEGLDRRLADFDASLGSSTDERVLAVHHENRALLVARRAKVEALLADRDRMLANARGFLLATENLHLDTARVGTDSTTEIAELTAPIRRLQDEVEVLRRVERELQKL